MRLECCEKEISAHIKRIPAEYRNCEAWSLDTLLYHSMKGNRHIVAYTTDSLFDFFAIPDSQKYVDFTIDFSTEEISRF